MSEGSRAAGRPARRAAHSFASLALLAIASLSTSPCRAQADAATTAIAIDWTAPAGCPSYADVASWLDAVLPPEVKQRLGGARATVTIEALPNESFRAAVRVVAAGEERERTLEGPACEELARSAVIIVSVGLTEVVNQAPPAAAPPPAAPPSQSQPPRAAPPAVQAPAPAPRPEPSAVLTLAAGISSGFGAPALRVDLAARWPLAPHASLGARLHAVPSAGVDTRLDTVEVQLFAGAPEGCLVGRALSTLHFGGCLRAELGIVRAAGSGARGLDDSALWAAVGALPFAEWGTHVRLVIAGDVDVRLLRPTLELDDGQMLEQLPRVAYTGLVGLAAAIP